MDKLEEFIEESKESEEEKVVLLCGKTGAGKSYLGNKISLQSCFQESKFNGQKSQTLNSDKISCFIANKNTKIILVDTPGFSDNRPDQDDVQIIIDIITLVNGIGSKISLVLYCQKMGDRFDIDEFQFLGDLLGKDIYKNMVFIQTQVRPEVDNEALLSSLIEEIPSIIEEHDEEAAQLLSPEKFLLATESEGKLSDDFLEALEAFVHQAIPFRHKLAEVQFSDLEKTQKLINNDCFATLLEKKLEIIQKKLKKATENLKIQYKKGNQKKKEEIELNIEILKQSELKIQDLLQKNLPAYRRILQLKSRNQLNVQINQYIHLEDQNSKEPTLLKDIQSILRKWFQSRSGGFFGSIKIIFCKNAMNELSSKLPPLLTQRIMDFYGVQLQELAIDINEELLFLNQYKQYQEFWFSSFLSIVIYLFGIINSIIVLVLYLFQNKAALLERIIEEVHKILKQKLPDLLIKKVNLNFDQTVQEIFFKNCK